MVGDDAQKDTVLRRLLAHVARSAEVLRDRASDDVSLLVMFHGANEAAVSSICSFGAKDLRRTDPGFAGAGIYSAMQAEYAAKNAIHT